MRDRVRRGPWSKENEMIKAALLRLYSICDVLLNHERIVIQDETTEEDIKVKRKIYNVYQHDHDMIHHDLKSSIASIIWKQDNPFSECYTYGKLSWFLKLRIKFAWEFSYGFSKVKLNFNGECMRLEAKFSPLEMGFSGNLSMGKKGKRQ